LEEEVFRPRVMVTHKQIYKYETEPYLTHHINLGNRDSPAMQLYFACEKQGGIQLKTMADNDVDSVPRKECKGTQMTIL
jgi:hypothetical protein